MSFYMGPFPSTAAKAVIFDELAKVWDFTNSVWIDADELEQTDFANIVASTESLGPWNWLVYPVTMATKIGVRVQLYLTGIALLVDLGNYDNIVQVDSHALVRANVIKISDVPVSVNASPAVGVIFPDNRVLAAEKAGVLANLLAMIESYGFPPAFRYTAAALVNAPVAEIDEEALAEAISDALIAEGIETTISAETIAAIALAAKTAVWANAQRTLTGSASVTGPNAARNPYDGKTVCHQHGTLGLYARIKDWTGEDITIAGVSTIAYTIYRIERSARSAVAGHHLVALDPAEVFFDDLQTDDWASNYNFKHVVAIAAADAFAAEGDYLIEYSLLPVAGQKIVFRFKIKVD